jgi:anaerobic selenocysteine-containing dehydrogenase
MANSRTNHCDRRGFLKGAAAGAVALAATPELTGAAPPPQAPAVGLPSAQALAAETQPVPVDVQGLVEDHPDRVFAHCTNQS